MPVLSCSPTGKGGGHQSSKRLVIKATLAFRYRRRRISRLFLTACPQGRLPVTPASTHWSSCPTTIRWRRKLRCLTGPCNASSLSLEARAPAYRPRSSSCTRTRRDKQCVLAVIADQTHPLPPWRMHSKKNAGRHKAA